MSKSNIATTQTNESSPTHQNLTINISSSIIASTITSAGFHPIDRAQFLAIYHKRTFFTKVNFTHPFQGIGQTMCQKPITGSLYYFAQGELQTSLKPYLVNELKFSETGAQFYVGLSAGAFDSILKNPISAIKAHTWQNGKKISFYESMTDMWKKGRLSAFTKGTSTGLYRDIPFGGIYEGVRNQMRLMINPYFPNSHFSQDIHTKTKSAADFVCDTVAAGTATVSVSFFNYARTIQHGTEPEKKPPTILESISSLTKESKKIPGIIGKMGFFQRSLCIGPGTARVALGMSVGQYITDTMRKTLS